MYGTLPTPPPQGGVSSTTFFLCYCPSVAQSIEPTTYQENPPISGTIQYHTCTQPCLPRSSGRGATTCVIVGGRYVRDCWGVVRVTSELVESAVVDKANHDGAGADALTSADFALSDPRLPDNPIVFASQGFYDLTGYSREEVCMKYWNGFFF